MADLRLCASHSVQLEAEHEEQLRQAHENGLREGKALVIQSAAENDSQILRMPPASAPLLSPPQGVFRIIKNQTGGGLPQPPPPPFQTKVTIVGKNEIYTRKDLVGPLWDTNFWDPPPRGMHWKGGSPPPPPLEGAQPTPSHCPPDAKCQFQWHL